MGNRGGRTTGKVRDMGHRKGGQAGVRRETGIGSEKASIGGECVGVPGFLRVERCRLDSALTASGTGATGDWSWPCGGWPRPKRTWASSRIPIALTASTPARLLVTESLRRVRQDDTAAEWQFSTGRHQILRWRPCDSLVPTLLTSSWRRGRSGDTSLDATSTLTTLRK